MLRVKVKRRSGKDSLREDWKIRKTVVFFGYSKEFVEQCLV
jgi:hypothetical protein